MPSKQAPPTRPPGGTIELAPGVIVPADLLRFQFARSGGPGGQNVNKLNTKAELWVPLAALRGLDEQARHRLEQLAGRRLTVQGEIHISADTARTQEQNRSAAMERLRELLLRALHRPKARRPTGPSRASRRRRLEAKARQSQTKAQRQRAGADAD
jgi:ribosome-associated protein